MTPHRATWIALLGAGIAYEAWALHRCPDATLSATTRWVFRTQGRAGRVVFVALTAGIAAWYISHIIQPNG